MTDLDRRAIQRVRAQIGPEQGTRMVLADPTIEMLDLLRSWATDRWPGDQDETALLEWCRTHLTEEDQ